MPLVPNYDNRPDTPTRLAEKKQNTGDRFETLIYHIDDLDLFLTLDTTADPEGYDWVVVSLEDGTPVIELYDGQDFISVANLLSFYKLEHSRQWRPQIRNRFTRW